MRRPTRLFFTIILLSLLSSVHAFAAVLNVPGEYFNIQEAVNAAVYGDTVLVADGTYSGEGNYDIQMEGKLITLTSENGPESCVIDCLWMGHGILCQELETSATVISGFTIKNGQVTCLT